MTHAAIVFQISAILVLTAVPARTVHAQQWQQFRGPQAGVAPDDPRLPDTWTTTENVAWRIDIPGRSWSSPIVWDDHVFVVTAVNTKTPNQPLSPVITLRAVAWRDDERR
jgi:PQQ-like domain